MLRFVKQRFKNFVRQNDLGRSFHLGFSLIRQIVRRDVRTDSSRIEVFSHDLAPSVLLRIKQCLITILYVKIIFAN